jgi:hypothetical protein
MRATLGFICLALSLTVLAQQRPIEIDPNTRIQGGADVRESGGNAGAGAQSDNKHQAVDRAESEPRIDERGDVARPQNTDPLRDMPVSEREPQQRGREDGARGGTTPPQ